MIGDKGRRGLAIYHLRVKFVQRSKGRSSVAAAAYRSGERLVDERAGTVADYRRKSDIEHKEILLPDGVPEWLADRATLWNAVERQLNHPRGQPAFEVEVSLPRELGRAECAALARDFATKHFVREGLIVDLCIHRPDASDGHERGQPHAHMLITTRRWNADGSMARPARDLQDNPKLLNKIYRLEETGNFEQALLLSKGTNLAQWRKAWADYSNHFLDRAGSVSRIDHRTLAAQKIDREAMPNIGFAFHREVEGLRGRLARYLDAFKAVSWRNAMRDQFDRIRRSRVDLTAEFIANVQEHARELLKGLEPEQAPARDRGGDYER